MQLFLERRFVVEIKRIIYLDNKHAPVRYINHLLLSDTQESTQDNKQDVAISHSLRYNKIGISNWEACYENVFSAVFHNK